MDIGSGLKVGTELVGRMDALFVLSHITGLSESQIYLYEDRVVDDDLFYNLISRI